MKNKAFAVFAFCFAFAHVEFVGEIAGVSMPETITVEGKTLKLNGMGLYKKMFFHKVYIAGLYLENPAKDAMSIVSAEEIKRVHIAFLHDLHSSQIGEVIQEGFTRNFKAQMGALKDRLEKLKALIPNAKARDELVLTYMPGKGILVFAQGVERGIIEGKEFADALFSVWIGSNPINQGLKDALLGK